MLEACTSPTAQGLIERLMFAPLAQADLPRAEVRAARLLTAHGFLYTLGYGSSTHPVTYHLTEAGRGMIERLDAARSTLYELARPELELDPRSGDLVIHLLVRASTAILDPTRVRILLALMIRPHTESGLIPDLGLDQPIWMVEYHVRRLAMYGFAAGFPRLAASGVHFTEYQARSEPLPALLKLALILIRQYTPDVAESPRLRVPDVILRELQAAQATLNEAEATHRASVADGRIHQGAARALVKARDVAALALIEALTPSDANNLAETWFQVMNVLRFATYHRVIQRLAGSSRIGGTATADLAEGLGLQSRTILQRLATLRALGFAGATDGRHTGLLHWTEPLAQEVIGALTPLTDPVFHATSTSFSLARFVHLLADPTRRRMLQPLLQPGSELASADLQKAASVSVSVAGENLEELAIPGLVRRQREGRRITYVCPAPPEGREALEQTLRIDDHPHLDNSGPRPLLDGLNDPWVQAVVRALQRPELAAATEAAIAVSLDVAAAGEPDSALRRLLNGLAAMGILDVDKPTGDPGTWHYDLSAEAVLVQAALAEVAAVPEHQMTPVQQAQRTCSLLRRGDRLVILLLLAGQQRSLTAAELGAITGYGSEAWVWPAQVGMRTPGAFGAGAAGYQVPRQVGDAVRHLFRAVARQAGADEVEIETALGGLGADDPAVVRWAVSRLQIEMEGPVGGLWSEVMGLFRESPRPLQLLHEQLERDSRIELLSPGTGEAVARAMASRNLRDAGLTTPDGEATTFGYEVVLRINDVTAAISAGQPLNVTGQRLEGVLQATASPERLDILRLLLDRGAATGMSIDAALGGNCGTHIGILFDAGLLEVMPGRQRSYRVPPQLRSPVTNILRADSPGGRYHAGPDLSWQPAIFTPESIALQ